MHVHRAHDIPVTFKSTGFASPVPPLGLMTMAAYGTPAGCATLIPGEAHDAVLFRLLLQVIDVLAIPPLAHALVVVTPGVLASHPIRVADEHRFHFMRLAEIHHLAGSLMAQVTDAALTPQGQFSAGFAKFPPTPGTLLTTGAFFLDFAKLLAVLTLEGADATPGDDQRIPIVGDHGSLMNLAQIHGGVSVGRSRQRRIFRIFRIFGNADMQFVVQAIPDDFTGARLNQPFVVWSGNLATKEDVLPRIRRDSDRYLNVLLDDRQRRATDCRRHQHGTAHF